MLSDGTGVYCKGHNKTEFTLTVGEGHLIEVDFISSAPTDVYNVHCVLWL